MGAKVGISYVACKKVLKRGSFDRALVKITFRLVRSFTERVGSLLLTSRPPDERAKGVKHHSLLH